MTGLDYFKLFIISLYLLNEILSFAYIFIYYSIYFFAKFFFELCNVCLNCLFNLSHLNLWWSLIRRILFTFYLLSFPEIRWIFIRFRFNRVFILVYNFVCFNLLFSYSSKSYFIHIIDRSLRHTSYNWLKRTGINFIDYWITLYDSFWQ